MLKCKLLALGFVFLVPRYLLSQDSIPKRIYNTMFIQDVPSIKIDGFINDLAWDLVEWSGNYLEWSPDENTEPSQQSKLKILYDEKNLYVAFRCYDEEPKKIVSRLSRRDGFEGDWVEINVASVGDKRTAYSFTISVSGVKGEEYITNDGASWDNTWNPIWYAKTNIDDEGWTAEVRIPLSQIRFGKDKEQIWGIQSTRRFFRKEERSVWQRSPQNAPGWVSNFGELRGLKNLRPQRQLEIQPYIVTSLTTYEKEEGNPFRDGSDMVLNGGVDGKLGITNDLTLDFTINPDFGQVEADPSTIALDGFQIFFQERRPFFIENKNIFNYQYSSSRAGNTFGSNNLFYSRRIGRSPQAYPNLVSGEYADIPDVTTILGAAKFSGKTRDGWSIGILESATSEERATINDGTNDRKEVVEPFTNYFVGRVQKDFNNNNTLIGGMFTSVNRNLDENSDFLHKAAYTGGLDFMHQWKNRNYYIKGNFVFSNVKGSEEAILNTQQSITRLFQRPDASYLMVDDTLTSLTGSGGNIQIGKAAGNWRYETGFLWQSPQLELNDLGFQLRADDYRHYGWLSYRTTTSQNSVRAFNINYTQLATFDFGNNLNELAFGINGWVNLNNNWFINGATTYKPVQYSNFALRGGPRLRYPEEYIFQLGIISDTRKKLSFTLNYYQEFGTQKAYDFKNFNGTITYQPINAFKVSLLPSFSIYEDKLQYVSTTGNSNDIRYINATISQKELGLPIRLDYLLTPDLSLQYWGQPFISRGRYNTFKYISKPLAKSFEKRFETYSDAQLDLSDGVYEVDENFDGIMDYSFLQPDFAYIQWRSNLVLRWEYIPGSEIYLVWSQDNADIGNINDSLFKGLNSNTNKPQNIFLIKATYRFMR